jgi:DNA-directed RNA polymerase specialized sigma24 family protein
MSTPERDTIIMAMLEESKGMIVNMAYKGNMDIDDCMQNAAIAMLEAWPKIPETCTNVKAYLHRCIRNKILKFHQGVIKELADSLDKPIPSSRDGRDITLADRLVAPEQAQDTARVDSIIETVHNALHDLMLDEQTYAKQIFELHAFSPMKPTRTNKRMDLHLKRASEGKARMLRSIRFSIYASIKDNPQVQALLPA